MDFKKLKDNKFQFVYLTTTSCNVCKVLEPKIIKLIQDYPQISFQKIYLDDEPAAKGEFMAFTVPTLVIFSEGKELFRSARNISIMELQQKLDRYYNLIF